MRRESHQQVHVQDRRLRRVDEMLDRDVGARGGTPRGQRRHGYNHQVRG